MYVVWFFLLLLSSTIYLQHTIQDVAERAAELVARRCLPHFNIHWIHIYSEKMHKRAIFIVRCLAMTTDVYIFRSAVTVWFFVDDKTIAWRSFSFRIFTMPNGSCAASIKYDAILPRIPIFCFFALNFQASNTIKLSVHVCGRSIAKCISAHSSPANIARNEKQWKKKSILKCWRICGDNAHKFSTFP